MSFWAAIGARAATKFIDSAFDFGTNAASSALQYKYQKRLLESQQQYNTEMWNKQNAYNDPSAQVQRLQGAGINPMLAFSGGIQNVGASSSTPSAPSFSMPSGHYGDFSANVLKDEELQLQRKMADAQIDYYSKLSNNVGSKTYAQDLDNFIRAQTALDEVDAKSADYQSRKYVRDLAFENLKNAQRENAIGDATLQYDVSIKGEEASQAMIRSSTMRLEKEAKRIGLKWMDRQYCANLADTWSRVSLNYAQGKASLTQAKAAMINAFTQGRYFGSMSDYNEMRNWSIDQNNGWHYESKEGEADLKDWLNSEQSTRDLKNALLVGAEKGLFDLFNSFIQSMGRKR